MRRFAGLFAFLVLAAAILGCGGKGGDKNQGAASPKLPEDFAKVFPLPEGTSVTHLTGSIQGKTYEAQFSAGGLLPRDVRDFYSRALTQDGWELNPSTASETPWADSGTTIFASAHGNGYFVTVTIRKQGPPTPYKVMVGIGR